jgi:ribosomal protein S27E
MPLVVTCPKCNRKLKVADAMAGKNIKCPGCASVFVAETDKPAAIQPKAVAPPSSVNHPATQGEPRPSNAPRSDPDEELERPAAPSRRRREKKKSNTVRNVVIGVVLGAILVVGSIVGGIVWLVHKAKVAVEETVYNPPAPMIQGGGPNPPPWAPPPVGGQPQPQPNSPSGAPKTGIGSKVLAGFPWMEFKDPNGRYTVIMPRAPRQDGPNYFVVTALEFGNLQESVFSYSFDVLYDKREDEARSLEEQIKDWRKTNTNSEFKPLKDQAIQVKGRKGWEIAFKDSKMKVFVRRWFVELSQGVALVSVNVPDTPDWIAAGEKFFASFTPLDKK